MTSVIIMIIMNEERWWNRDLVFLSSFAGRVENQDGRENGTEKYFQNQQLS